MSSSSKQTRTAMQHEVDAEKQLKYSRTHYSYTYTSTRTKRTREKPCSRCIYCTEIPLGKATRVRVAVYLSRSLV